MTFWLNICKDALNLAIRPNDNRIPPDLPGLRAGAVGSADLTVSIGQQGVGKVIPPGKGRVGLYRVHTDAQNLRLQRLKFVDSITESGPLNNSARRIGLRVEPQHDRLPSIVS